jgi:hypothetical protein
MENAMNYIGDADTQKFEVWVGDNLYEGIFTNARIDRSTLPKDWYAYDLREDSEFVECIEIKNGSIIVNHYGTFLTQKKIVELEKKDSSLVRNVYYNEGPQEFDYSFQ